MLPLFLGNPRVFQSKGHSVRIFVMKGPANGVGGDLAVRTKQRPLSDSTWV